MKYGYLVAVYLLVVSPGCEKEQICKSTELKTASLESVYGCENTTQALDIDLGDTFTVIRSQEDFERLVSGSCSPDIDFDRYDLIIGKQKLNSGVADVEYDYVRTCEGNLVLEVEIERNLATVISNITYHALVDKVRMDESVKVKVSVNP